MAGLLVLAFGVVVGRLVPARARETKTLAAESELRRKIGDAEERRKRLELFDRGLEQKDLRVTEHFLRDQGMGREGEERIIAATESKPSSK